MVSPLRSILTAKPPLPHLGAHGAPHSGPVWPSCARTIQPTLTPVNPSTIRVITADPALRNALVGQIERSGRFALATRGEPILDGAGLDDIVITTPADCTAEECLAMVERGARVIILTPVPRERERQLYTGSGASAYLPMVIDGGQLMDAVDAALHPASPPYPLSSDPCPR